MSLEKKDFAFEVKLLSDENNGLTFEGFASTFGNTDLVNDIVAPGAFKKSLKRRVPKMLLQHDFKQPIGVFTEIKETDTGLFVKGKLIKGIQASDETALLLRNGVIDSMSIGFNVLDSERSSDANILKEIDLFEVSLVTFPANPMATVTGMKSVVSFNDLPILMRDGKFDTSREWDSSSAVENIRKNTGSVDEPSDTYRDAFLFFDGDGSKFNQYKLPIADIIDGKLTAIPRALFSAAAVLSGARGGVDISDTDKNAVISSVNKYYSKMGMDSPFNKSGGLLINSHQAKLINNKREFEKLLRDSGCFSKSAAILLAANWSIQGEPDVEEKQVNLIDIKMNELNKLLDSVIKKL